MEIGPRRHALQLFADRLETRSPLSDVERDAVLALPGHPHRREAHRDIIRADQDVQHACLIAEGLAGRFAQLADGSRQFTGLHIPGDQVGLDALMLPGPAVPLHALTGSTVIAIPRAALERLAADHAGLAAAFWRDCMADSAIVARWLVNAGRKNARSRIAHLLCEMAMRYDRIGRMQYGTFTFHATQEQIADMVGLTSVHVNRSIRTLREDGLIRWSRSDVAILDWTALAAIGEFDTGYLHFGSDRGRADRTVRAQAS